MGLSGGTVARGLRGAECPWVSDGVGAQEWWAAGKGGGRGPEQGRPVPSRLGEHQHPANS